MTRWLATAEKQRRFRKEVAPDIRWLLKEGRQKGLRADLPGKLEYLWRAGSGNLLSQNHLYRLQHAMNALRLTDWMYGVLTEAEWKDLNKKQLNSSVSCIYINKKSLDAAFDSEGQQIMPLNVLLKGEISGLDELLQRSGWYRAPVEGKPLLHQLHAH